MERRAKGFAMPVVKIRFVLRPLAADGWYLSATKGGNRPFAHSVMPGRVTVSGKDNDDSAPGTFNSILKPAGLNGQ